PVLPQVPRGTWRAETAAPSRPGAAYECLGTPALTSSPRITAPAAARQPLLPTPHHRTPHSPTGPLNGQLRQVERSGRPAGGGALAGEPRIGIAREPTRTYCQYAGPVSAPGNAVAERTPGQAGERRRSSRGKED